MIARCIALGCLGFISLHVDYANAQIEYVFRDYPIAQDGGKLVGTLTVADNAADDGMLMEDEILAFEWTAFDANGVQAAAASSSMDGSINMIDGNLLIDSQRIALPGGELETYHSFYVGVDHPNPNLLIYSWERDHYKYAADSPAPPGGACTLLYCNPVWQFLGGAPNGEPWVIAGVPFLDTDGDGLLDLLDVPGFDPSLTGDLGFYREGIEDLDGANQLTKATDLNLGSNRISNIDAGDFAELADLKWLSLHLNQIASIESGSFEGLTNLQWLDLSGNSLTSVEAGDFDGLSNLQELTLLQNKIANLEAGAFTGLTNLQTLYLIDNRITNIEAGDFDGLTNLQELSILQNQIRDLEPGAFAGLHQLRLLDLQLNQITGVEAGDFAGLPNLQTLKLASNQIGSIGTMAFNGLSNLQTLSLEQNLISNIEAGDFTGLSDLQSLKLWASNIEAGGFTGLTNLQSLDLHWVPSIEAGDFTGLSNLQSLNLSASNVEAGGFTGLTNLQSLDLRSVSSVEAGMFEGLSSLSLLNLWRNENISLGSGGFSGLLNLQSLNLGNVPNRLGRIEDGAFEGLDRLVTLEIGLLKDGEMNLRGADLQSLREILGANFAMSVNSLYLDDADLSSGSFSAIMQYLFRVPEASLVGLSFADSGPENMSLLLGLSGLSDLTIDTNLYRNYQDEFDAFAAQSGNTLTIVDPDCSGDGVLNILDANCTPGRRIKYFLEDYGTVPGDADGVGGVEFADFLILQSNFGQSPAVYTDGDFDVDGKVAFTDFLILSGNYGQGEDFTAGSTAAAPEPSSLLGLLLAVLLLSSCRKSSRI